MKLNFKHKTAQDAVGRLLDATRRNAPGLLEVFPRSIEEILQSLDLPVELVRINGLTTTGVKGHLKETCGVALVGEPDGLALGGYTYGAGGGAVVFCETGHGEHYARFSLAHEGFHVLEHIDLFESSKNQRLLFDSGQPMCTTAHRDPPQHLFDGEGNPSAPLAQDRQTWLREVKANCFAAELLIPAEDLVKAIASWCSDLEASAGKDAPAGKVLCAKVAVKYGVSQTAARIRLTDLGLALGGGEGGRSLELRG